MKHANKRMFQRISQFPFFAKNCNLIHRIRDLTIKSSIIKTLQNVDVIRKILNEYSQDSRVTLNFSETLTKKRKN